MIRKLAESEELLRLDECNLPEVLRAWSTILGERKEPTDWSDKVLSDPIKARRWLVQHIKLRHVGVMGDTVSQTVFEVDLDNLFASKILVTAAIAAIDDYSDLPWYAKIAFTPKSKEDEEEDW